MHATINFFFKKKWSVFFFDMIGQQKAKTIKNKCMFWGKETSELVYEILYVEVLNGVDEHGTLTFCIL